MPDVPSTPCLVGPTGSGKSDVGVLLARAAGPGSEVISCDAFAVYRGMAILTAAPDAPQDVPHRLVGILGPDEVYEGNWLDDVIAGGGGVAYNLLPDL